MDTPASDGSRNIALLNAIRSGMAVYTSNDHKIGVVKEVHRGRDFAAPPAMPATVHPDLNPLPSETVTPVALTQAPPPLPAAFQGRMLEHGYIRIDTSGIEVANYYAFPEQIASVSPDHVTLTVTHRELLEE